MVLKASKFDAATHAATAAERWKWQYCANEKAGIWDKTESGSSEAIYKNLRALGDLPSPEAVDAVIGNNSWTTFMCDGCYEHVRAGIFIESESKIIEICDDCSEPLRQVLDAKP